MRAPILPLFNKLARQCGAVSINWGLLFALIVVLLLQMGSALGQTKPGLAPDAPPATTQAVPPPSEEEPPYDDALFISTSMPSTIEVNTTMTVTVLMRNTGSTTWYPGQSNPYRLGSVNPTDNLTWGVGRVELGPVVYPTGNATFTLNIKAPSVPGTYTFSWQMLREGSHWFGSSGSRTITVTAPVPVYNAQLTGTNVPTAMTAGSTYNVGLTFRNSGNVTWNRSELHRIGTSSPYDNMIFGVNRADMSVASVAPGQSATFNFQVTAPATAGTYIFDWGMLWEYNMRFGQTSAINITVGAAAPKPTISVQHLPSPVAGSPFTTYWAATNATSLSRVCTASGTGYTVSETVPVNSSRTQLALAAWVNYPSTCTWTANGAGGSTTYRETLTTAAAATAKPVINVTRSSAPVAGQAFTTTWSTSNATALTHVCTASGTGYKVNESLAVNGSRTEMALAAWSGYPSACTWTASGAGGSTTYTETFIIDPGSKPTIQVTRNQAPTAGQAFTTVWSTTRATTLSRVCTASGSGYNVNESLVVSDSRTVTALAAWVGYPSSCTWTANGTGGTTTYTETVTTAAAATGGVTYIHTDGLGSPVARTDSAKQVISRTRYEAYGYVAAGAQPTIGFTGHVNDVDTGLTYMQQRYYDPVAGRFLSIDPVITDVNTGSSFNRYNYAANNPYKYIDPDGRSWTLAGRGAILGAQGGFLVCGPLCSAAGAVVGGAVTGYAGHKALQWIENRVDNKASGTNSDGQQIEDGKQGKHVPGHNNFQEGKSELTHPDPQGLVDDHRGTGQQIGDTQIGQPGSRERVDFGTKIGNYVDPVTGEKSPTTNGIIHESSKGVHIVPSRPDLYDKRDHP